VLKVWLSYPKIFMEK